MIRWTVLILAVAGGLWTAVLVAFGGVDVQVFGKTITSNDPRRTLFYAALLLSIYILAGGVVTIPDRWRRAPGRIARAVVQVAPVVGRFFLVFTRIDGRILVGVIALLVLLVGIRFGGTTVGGADAYGYVSQADLWLSGRLTVPQPWAEEAPWPDAAWTFSPLGYRPVPGGSIVPTYSPGLPLVMAGAKLIGGDCAVFWVSPISGAVLVITTYGIGRRLGSKRVGLIAAWLAATSPTLLGMIVLPMSDVPVAAMWAVAFWLLLVDTIGSALAAGLMTALAVFTRTNLAPMAAVLPMWLAFRAWRASGNERLRNVKQLAAFLVGAAPGPLAVAALNAYWYGSPFKSGYGYLRDLFSWSTIPQNLRNYTTWLAQTQTVLVFAGVAALFVPARRIWPYVSDRSVILAFGLFVFGVWAEYLAYFVFDDWGYLRFLLPCLPFIMIGMATLADWVIARRQRVLTMATCATILVLGLRGIELAEEQNAFKVAKSDTKYAVVAKIAQRVVPPNSVVVAMQHSGSLRYYGGRMTMRYDFMDAGWLDRSVEWLSERGIRTYALLEDWELERFQSRFARQRLGSLAAAPLVVYQNADALLYVYDLQRPLSDTKVENIVEAFTGPKCLHPGRKPTLVLK